jgi:hypothetical protein
MRPYRISAVSMPHLSRRPCRISAVKRLHLSRDHAATQPSYHAASQPWATAELRLYVVLHPALNLPVSFKHSVFAVSSTTQSRTSGRGVAALASDCWLDCLQKQEQKLKELRYES